MSPLLTLCMIVKNEAHGIAKTLRSVRPFVDRWCILDTGSTDGTQQIIVTEMEGVPGEVRERPFDDFASSRNALLDWASEGSSVYLLLLDSDDILEGGENLKTQCERSLYPMRLMMPQASSELDCIGPEPAFYLSTRWGDCEYRTCSLIRADAARTWRYRGAVHEVLIGPNGEVPKTSVPGVLVRKESPPKSDEARAKRLLWDAQVLEEAVKENPKDARSLFYLAETKLRLGHFEEAARTYAGRILLGGWSDEVFCSMLQSARIGRWRHEAKMQKLLEVFSFSPYRAEPLVDLAELARSRDEHALAFMFAARAIELPFPEGSLFVELSAYTWKPLALAGISAWYIGEFERGEAFTRRALDCSQLPDDWRIHLEENLTFYDLKTNS